MTHTAEPMTLKSLSGEMRNAVSLSERPTFAQIDMWADTIDAELAKQREAEPVAWIEVVEDGSNQYGKNAKAYALRGSMELSIGMHDLYTHTQQRNAVEVTDEMIDLARNAYKATKRYHTGDFPEGSIRSVADINRNDDEAWKGALSAVASRDREDAK